MAALDGRATGAILGTAAAAGLAIAWLIMGRGDAGTPAHEAAAAPAEAVKAGAAPVKPKEGTAK